MKCDIVIPTYNNGAVLRETLKVLTQSQAPRSSWSCRVIVSDDGSIDDTPVFLKNLNLPPPWQLSVVSGEHAGPAVARNRALPHVTADILFFLGADILLRPAALARHLAFHEQHPKTLEAALGMVRWDPRLPPTPLMEWLTHGGQQNDFDSLLGQEQADPAHFFYASHLSLKRSLLGASRFPVALSGYGWEDLSLGRTLKKRGVTLHVLHSAIGLHQHHYSLSAIAKRQRAVGFHLKHYQALHPDLAMPLPRSRLKYLIRVLYILLGGQAALFVCLTLCKKLSLPWLFLVFTSNAFWQGVWRSHGGLLALLREKKMFYAKSP